MSSSLCTPLLAQASDGTPRPIQYNVSYGTEEWQAMLAPTKAEAAAAQQLAAQQVEAPMPEAADPADPRVDDHVQIQMDEDAGENDGENDGEDCGEGTGDDGEDGCEDCGEDGEDGGKDTGEDGGEDTGEDSGEDTGEDTSEGSGEGSDTGEYSHKVRSRDHQALTNAFRIVKAMFAVEHSVTAMFYWLGWKHLFFIANISTDLFLITSLVVQYYLAAHFDRTWRRYYCCDVRKFWKEPLKSIGPVPMSWTGLKSWHFRLVSVSPNYIHPLSTAVAVGAAWATWPCEEEAFAERWQFVPVIGPFVGNLGLPWALTGLLVVHFLGHSVAVFLPDVKQDAESVCDGANLLFFTRLFKNNGEEGLSVVRMGMALLTKVPMLWLKVSLLAMSYDNMSGAAIRSMVQAIALGFYAIVPVVVPPFWTQFKDSQSPPLVALAFTPFALLFAIIGSHIVGIWACPSHDFSIAAWGCTNATGVTGNCTAAEA